MDISELKAIVESLLFVSDVPLRPERIAETIEVDRGQVLQILRQLEADYRQERRGFVLDEVAGGFQFRTRAEYVDWVRRLNKSRPFRFSRAALETLAIVAYRQPITRAEIEYLRGVDSGGVVKTLLDRHLLRILGKKDIAGRPMIYGTTREFLEVFGLRDLAALPTLKEFSEVPPEAFGSEGSLANEVSPAAESGEDSAAHNLS